MNRSNLKNRLVIGSANFSQKYGNQKFQIKLEEIKKILNLAKKNQILKIFVINGSIIGILGTVLGCFLGLIFCININEIKSFIELFLDSNLFSEEIYFFSKLPAIINYSQIVKIALISIFLSFLSTIYPSIRASKVDPINLIKWD